MATITGTQEIKISVTPKQLAEAICDEIGVSLDRCYVASNHAIYERGLVHELFVTKDPDIIFLFQAAQVLVARGANANSR